MVWGPFACFRAQASLQRDCSLLALRSSDGLLHGAFSIGTADLLGELTDGEGSSLSVDHDAETIEISESGAFVSLFHFLGGRRGSEFLGELKRLGSLVDSGGPCATEDWQSEFGEGKSAHGVEAAREVLAINEHLLSVNPVNNDNKLAVIFSEVNVSNSTSFNVISKDLHARLNEVHIPFLLLYYYIK